MADRKYALAPVFCIRAAGVSFEPLEAVGSRAIATAGRALLEAHETVARVASVAIEMAREASPSDPKPVRRLLDALKARRPVTPEQREAYAWLGPYARALVEVDRIGGDLEPAIEAEVRRGHREIRAHAVRELPDFALIESPPMLDKLAHIAREEPSTTAVRSDDRKTDRALAMYLQRVCAKGDTISRFGPSGWGTVVDDNRLQIAPTPGILARRIEVERWVVTAVIDAINGDAEVRDEICPRLHPLAVIEGDQLTRIDRAASVPLTADERATLDRCGGQTPAHAFDAGVLARLVEHGAIIWQLERYAIDTSPLASLVTDVAAWRSGEPRTRWLAQLARLEALAHEFGTHVEVAERRDVLVRFESELAAIGIAMRERGRTLYAAANPISENCFRDYGFALPAHAARRLVDDASPWFDLFADSYALGVAGAFTLYRALIASAPRRAGKLSYAAFVLHARDSGVEIENDAALVRCGREAFASIKQVLAAALEDRAGADEIELTADDCHVLRRLHDLPHVEELAYPQADLQIASASLEAFNAGRYRWVIAELHQPLMPLQHLLYWSCPDKPALHAAMAAALAHRPMAIRGSLAEQPVHVAGEAVFAALPKPTLVHGGRPKPAWRSVRPALAEVIVDDDARDIRLSSPSGEDLGSLVRGFRIMMGMHPFFPYERSPHAPRLRMGSTIVQRRHWHVTSSEIGTPRPAGVSSALVVGVERLRRDRGVPRWVFARPSYASLRAQAKTTDDMYARDKDVKPFYVDLESVLFLDIFERRLQKYGELVISEMLPSPDELVWSEPSGRTVFELRTSIVPEVSR